MKIPFLSVEIINSNKSDVLDVLQGISRYIEVIYIRKELVENEGWEILNFLTKRYPKKKIILNITEFNKVNSFIDDVIKNTEIKTFIIRGNLEDTEFKKLYNFLLKNKKEIILNTENLSDFNTKITDKFLYSKKQNKDNKFWRENNLKFIKDAIAKQKYLIVGNIIADNIEAFGENWINEFIVSEEVCYSYNPVETCKLIYLSIKKNYLK